MAYRSTEIANEFLKRAPGGLTQMQLQKLTFIANGWNYVVNGDRLVDDPAEAWDFGPVFPSLYHHTKLFGRGAIKRPITPDDDEPVKFFLNARPESAPYAADLDDRERAVIDHVWSRYGQMTGGQLSALTHRPGTPWQKSYVPGRNTRISEDLVREHYQELADRATAA
jgi:uncharacterized phage-associated protein